MSLKNDVPYHLTPKALSAALSAICAGMPAAYAQDIEEEAPEENESSTAFLEEVFVTATKREESLQDIPMSVVAFTDEQIVSQGFKQLDDYAGQIPSLAFGRREPGGTNVIMRGCAVSGIAFSDNPTTAVYLDEQPITSAGFNPDPRLVDIERVEALSGPQGSLFGDASQCGTLRIITNKPDTTAFESWVDLSGETIDDGGAGYDFSAMINVPLVENKVAFRLVGFAAQEAGYVDNILGVSPGGENAPGGTFGNGAFVEDDVNETDVTGMRAGLRFTPSDNTTIDLNFSYQNTESDGFGDTDIPENLFANQILGEWEQVRFGDDYWEDEWYQAALTIESSLGWADLTFAASFMNRETRYDADSTSYLSSWQERYPYLPIYNFPDSDPQAMSFDRGETDRTSFELRLATPADSDSRWSGVVGMFYNEIDGFTDFSANVRDLPSSGFTYYYQNGIEYYSCGAHCYLNYVAFYYNCDTETGNTCQDPVAPSENWWSGFYDNQVEQKAFFGEATFDVTDNFSVTLGGRFFDVETKRVLSNGTLQPLTQPFTVQGPRLDCSVALCYQDERSSSSEDGFVPKVNFTYNFDPDRMVYFTYSEGFRRGGSNAARPRSIFGRPPFNTFESDEVANYEIGAKLQSPDGRLRFNITAYHMVWDNIQVEAEDPTPGLFTLGIANFPEAEIDGVEVFVDYAPDQNWLFTANVGYNDAKLSEAGSLEVDGVDLAREAAAGTPLPLVPDWKSNISASYKLDQNLLGGNAYWRVDWQFTGDSVSSLAGIQSIEFDNPVRKQPSYSIWNMRFGIEGDDWTASVYLNNAFNEYAKQFYNDRWGQTRLSVNRPRTLGVNFRKYWGK